MTSFSRVIAAAAHNKLIATFGGSIVVISDAIKQNSDNSCSRKKLGGGVVPVISLMLAILMKYAIKTTN
jgi:hypothetical protein